ncbi:hypothetical protein PAXINDRAFT_14994 [Paxillus involutus ATCC 200175]|uniref:DUF6532 domain-containing protein n=1 Tax=Paxillus involutus ATCC 200175 TaxID=664439 RepID=A0A0C9TNY6_PAXIN|nr:hypothetical protein PAXINDRAFT_14994 [Paxillus involutus ATCC 200175]
MEVDDTGVDHHDKPWSPPPLDSEDEAGFGDEELQCEHKHLRGTTSPNSNLTCLQEAFGGSQHTEADINMSIDEAFDIDLNFGPPEDNGVDFEALASRSSSPAVQHPHPRPMQSRQQGAPTEQVHVNYNVLKRHHQKAGLTKEPPHDDQGDTAGYDKDCGVIHDGLVDHDEEADEQAGDEASRKSKNKRKARVLKENHNNPSLIGYYPTLCTAMLEMAKGYFWQYVVLVDPFPTRLEALSMTCDEMVAEALTTFMTLNRKIEDVAQGHLASEYDLHAPSSAKTKGERIKVVKDKVEKLVKGFLFLRGENDSNGKTLNFAHPGLRAICITAFYHSGSKSFCNHPEFKAALLYSAMLLVASLVKGYLDIYREHSYVPECSQVPLIKNKKDYLIMKTELQRVLDHPYHGPKLDNMLERWAEDGMTGFELDEGAGEDEECKIVLD